MKWISYILVAYFLLLVGMPCTDDFASPGNEQTTINTPHPEHRETGLDSCSPFCICSCCGQYVLFFSNQVLESFKDFPIESKLTFGYGFIFVSKYENNIWQPPKLG